MSPLDRPVSSFLALVADVVLVGPRYRAIMVPMFFSYTHFWA